MRTPRFIASLLLLATLIPAGSLAQTADAAEGEVRKIDRDAKKITLKHGPIKNLDMPGMTMVFQVRDQAVLVVYPDNVWYTFIDKDDVDEIISEHLQHGRVVERLKI